MSLGPPEPLLPDGTLLAAEPVAPVQPNGCLVLRTVAGPQPGAAFLVPPAGATLGRETDNAVVIPDRKVSRYHARIDRSEGSWLVVDLESTNGTRLNGVPVTRAGLSPGDYLYLGDTVLKIESAR